MQLAHHLPLAEKLQQNHLLAALSNPELERISPRMELLSLRVGDMLHQPNESLRYAYFPTSAIISLHYVTESGAASEIAGIGNEGVVGVSLVLGGATMQSSAVVQTAGNAYRLDRITLKEEFNRIGLLHRVLLRYTQTLMTQMFQSAVCNRHHSVEQQLCRLLLLTIDRIPDHELVMTQELVASMIGVRRESVTQAARNLQTSGLINYRRGHIAVLNRKGLEQRSCECYGVMKKAITQLLGDMR